MRPGHLTCTGETPNAVNLNYNMLKINILKTMHGGLPSAPPKGFTLQPDLLFLHCQKKVGKKTLVRKMLPPTGLRTPRFSDLPTRLCVYNQLIFNYLLLKLTALGETPVPQYLVINQKK